MGIMRLPSSCITSTLEAYSEIALLCNNEQPPRFGMWQADGLESQIFLASCVSREDSKVWSARVPVGGCCVVAAFAR